MLVASSTWFWSQLHRLSCVGFVWAPSRASVWYLGMTLLGTCWAALGYAQAWSVWNGFPVGWNLNGWDIRVSGQKHSPSSPWIGWLEMLFIRTSQRAVPCPWCIRSAEQQGTRSHGLALALSLLASPLSLTVPRGVALPNKLKSFVLASTFWRSQAKTHFYRKDITL